MNKLFADHFGNDLQTVVLNAAASNSKATVHVDGEEMKDDVDHASSDFEYNQTELQQLFRWLGEQKTKSIHWRENRSYLLVSQYSSHNVARLPI